MLRRNSQVRTKGAIVAAMCRRESREMLGAGTIRYPLRLTVPKCHCPAQAGCLRRVMSVETRAIRVVPRLEILSARSFRWWLEDGTGER